MVIEHGHLQLIYIPITSMVMLHCYIIEAYKKVLKMTYGHLLYGKCSHEQWDNNGASFHNYVAVYKRVQQCSDVQSSHHLYHMYCFVVLCHVVFCCFPVNIVIHCGMVCCHDQI